MKVLRCHLLHNFFGGRRMRKFLCTGYAASVDADVFSYESAHAARISTLKIANRLLGMPLP